MTKAAPFAVALVVALAVLVGCSEHNDTRGRGDAPVGDTDDSPRDVFNMPDTFANIAVFCDGPNRVYVTTREAPPVVIADDAQCASEPA